MEERRLEAQVLILERQGVSGTFLYIVVLVREMRKKGRRRNPLPEIQEEGLLTPLRRGSSAYAYTSAVEVRRFNDLEAGTTTESHLTSHVEMAAALVDQVSLLGPLHFLLDRRFGISRPLTLIPTIQRPLKSCIPVCEQPVSFFFLFSCKFLRT